MGYNITLQLPFIPFTCFYSFCFVSILVFFLTRAHSSHCKLNKLFCMSIKETWYLGQRDNLCRILMVLFSNLFSESFPLISTSPLSKRNVICYISFRYLSFLIQIQVDIGSHILIDLFSWFIM